MAKWGNFALRWSAGDAADRQKARGATSASPPLKCRPSWLEEKEAQLLARAYGRISAASSNMPSLNGIVKGRVPREKPSVLQYYIVLAKRKGMAESMCVFLVTLAEIITRRRAAEPLKLNNK